MLMFETLLTLLQATKIAFAAYDWDKSPSGVAYGVLSLTGGANTIFSDNHIDAQAVEGVVDLYDTSIRTDNAKAVQAVLDGMDGCTWRLNSVQYESDTRLVHYEWIINLESL